MAKKKKQVENKPDSSAPVPEEIQNADKPIIKRKSLFKDLMERRVPQILGGYFIGSFTIIQFIDWLVARYPMSPNLPDLCLAILVALLPTVVILAYFHGRPGRDKWTRVEKFGIPANVLTAIVVMIFLFNGRELGATTTKLTVQDESGVTIERTIPNSAFRKSLAIFFFDNTSSDTTQNWFQYAIPQMLTLDLYQDLFLDIGPPYLSYIKMKDAGYPEGVGSSVVLHNRIAEDLKKKYFLRGSFEKEENEFVVNALIYETKNGNLLSENTFKNEDIFSLVDEMSVKIKEELDIPVGHIEDVKDHPIGDIFTNSLEAMENYFMGQNSVAFEANWEKSLASLEKAVTIDPGFALAYGELQTVYMLSNQSEKAIRTAESMMKHLYRLPERVQLYLKSTYYMNIKQDLEKGIDVVKLWTDLYPDDLDAHVTLATIYKQTNRIDESINEFIRVLEIDPDKYDLLHTIGELYRDEGDFDNALIYYEKYAAQFPNKSESFSELGKLYQSIGDFEQAKINFEKASIINPGEVSVVLNLASVEFSLGNIEESVNLRAEAMQKCKTQEDSSNVYNSLVNYFRLKGNLDKELEMIQTRLVLDEKYLPEGYLFVSKLKALRSYVTAGREEEAFEIIQEIEAQVQAPFDLFVPLGYLGIYQELENTAKIEESIVGVELLISTFQLERLRADVLSARGKINEINGEYDKAISHYLEVIKLTPTESSINRKIGHCYQMLKDHKKAEEYMLLNLKYQPFNPKSNYEMAMIYHELGQESKALEHLRRALLVWEESDPEYKPAMQAKAKLLEWDQ